MTNLVSLNQTIIDVQTDFKKLLQKTYALIQKYNNAYGDGDGRAEFFVQSFLLNLWLLIQFDSFLEVFARRSNRVSRHAPFSPQDSILFRDQYDTINRASYCTKAILNVEHFLKSIVKLLGMNKEVGYGEMTRKLKNPLNLTDYQLDILNALAHVRNSLHNNGYHTEEDFEMVIRGKSYKFEKDKQVKFSGWDNLYIMFDEVLDVIVVIIESTEVKQLAKIPYASMTYHDTQQEDI
jgi:hypothetical protein